MGVKYYSEEHPASAYVRQGSPLQILPLRCNDKKKTLKRFSWIQMVIQITSKIYSSVPRAIDTVFWKVHRNASDKFLVVFVNSAKVLFQERLQYISSLLVEVAMAVISEGQLSGKLSCLTKPACYIAHPQTGMGSITCCLLLLQFGDPKSNICFMPYNSWAKLTEV